MTNPDPSQQTPPDPNATPPAGADPSQQQPPEPAAEPGASPAPDQTPPAAVWTDGEGFDDDLRKFVGEKTPAEIAKELQNAQKLIGKKSVGIPTTESTPEEWAAYHTARGVPENAEGYDFTSIKDAVLEAIPADQREDAWDEAEEEHWRGIFRQSNLSQTEATEVFRRGLEARMAKAAEHAETAQKVAAQVTDQITENWGNRAEEYTQDANNFARAMGLIEPNGNTDVFEALNQLAGSNADARFKLADFMRKQGAMMREGGQPNADPAGGDPAKGMTKDQAKQAKENYLNTGDNRRAYTDPGHPRHKEVEAEVTKFLKIERGRT